MRFLICLGSVALLSGCTTYAPIGETDNVWVSENYNLVGTSKMFYCVANKAEGKRPAPICYPAVYFDRRNGNVQE